MPSDDQELLRALARITYRNSDLTSSDAYSGYLSHFFMSNASLEEHKDKSEIFEQDELDPAVERALIRKIDWKLLPFLSLLYLLSFLDRANIGEYHAILSATIVPY